MTGYSERLRAAKFYLSGFLILSAIAAAVSYFHVARQQDLARAREIRAAIAELGPRIEIVTTEAGPSQRTIKLLGDVRSNATTTLFGKVPGYIRAISVDKGDRVLVGQVVAEIMSPELDQ